jgi:hypothetical protein
MRNLSLAAAALILLGGTAYAQSPAPQPPAQQQSPDQRLIAYLFGQRDNYEEAIIRLQARIASLEAQKDAPKPQASVTPPDAVARQLSDLRQQLANSQARATSLNQQLAAANQRIAALSPHGPQSVVPQPSTKSLPK